MTDLQPRITDQLLATKSIPAETRRRFSQYLFESISPKLQSEHEDVGWVVDRVLKTKVKMRRVKPHDVAFKDRVWAAMARLSFDQLNRDRNLKIAYGKSAGESKQFDVFAADDEVILIIECKSAKSLTPATFKTEVEAIKGNRAGILASIKREYPDHKVKFVLATNNFSISKESRERIENADIVHMDEDVVDYYLELADHLGKAARFQLLGSLFAGAKIPSLEPKVPAIKGKMGGHVYYSFAIEPERLLKLGYVLHRNKANNNLMPTYQRLIKKTRLKKVSRFVELGGFFPNSIILNIESKRSLKFDAVGGADGAAKLGVLHLPQTYRAAYVIDGQHRLYGYADSAQASSELVPVVAFVNLDRSDQVKLFMQINENQQAVPKNLRNTLNADLLWDSKDLVEQTRALKLRVAQYLGEDKSAALYGRIIVGENKRSATRCITIDAIRSGLDRGNFIGSFTKTEMREAGTLYKGTNQATFDDLTAYLDLCFWYLREQLPEQWALGNAEGGFLFINNGIDAFLRILSDIMDHLVKVEDINPRTETAKTLFHLSTVFLEPLIAALQNLSLEEAAELRRSYGSAGAVRSWRKMQTSIHDQAVDFAPTGFEEYLTDQKKEFNTESFNMIREIETFMNADIRRRLEDDLGPVWFKQGVPLKVYQAASALATDKNRDRSPEDELEPWECLHLIDYHAILSADHDRWVRLFEKRYTKPGDENRKGGWKARTNWIVELNRIRNENDHTYSVKEKEYEFLVAITAWLFEDSE